MARAKLKVRLLLPMALVIAAAALIAGVVMSLSYSAHGNYDLAVLAPLWLLGPGLVPLLVALLDRREKRRVPTPPLVLSLMRRPRRAR
ncbi:MAG TPA: hypothetical protein VKV28_02735 [Candidatus Binataceae bacterium]|nr:hypothetical protein [Candidatus Binataceae bacterium]